MIFFGQNAKLCASNISWWVCSQRHVLYLHLELQCNLHIYGLNWNYFGRRNSSVHLFDEFVTLFAHYCLDGLRGHIHVLRLNKFQLHKRMCINNLFFPLISRCSSVARPRIFIKNYVNFRLSHVWYKSSFAENGPLCEDYFQLWFVKFIQIQWETSQNHTNLYKILILHSQGRPLFHQYSLVDCYDC